MTIRVLCFRLLFCVVASASLAAQSQTADRTAAAEKAPRLPVPSGRFGVGRAGYEWIDQSRPDRFSSSPNAHRRLMVYFWYPTSPKNDSARGTYFPGARQMDAVAEIQRHMRDDFGANWPLIVSGAIYSHAVDNAPPAKEPKTFPTIVFSHGSGGSSFGNTSLIEDLVSRGYVVASIEHTYIAGVVVFPNGEIVLEQHDPMPAGLTPEERFKRMGESMGAGITEGAADVRFVVDRLFELDKQDSSHFPLAGRLDLRQLAAMGHSAGAEFAARACQLDQRIKACVDLDGGMVPVAALPEYPDGGTQKQPLLFLEAWHPESKMFGSPEQHAAYFKKKEEQFQTCCPSGSYAVELRSAGMVHGSFSDDPLLEAADPVAAGIARHNLDLIETFVRGFLDQTLRETRQTLFDGKPDESSIRKIGH